MPTLTNVHDCAAHTDGVFDINKYVNPHADDHTYRKRYTNGNDRANLHAYGKQYIFTNID